MRVHGKKSFWYSLPRKRVSFSYGNLRLFQISNLKNCRLFCSLFENFGFFAHYIKNRVSFSALTMEQTGLVLNETGLIYERRRSSSVPNVPASTVTLRSLLSEINALKEKTRQL